MTLKWECSECGETVKRQQPPVVCPSCGLAGVLFTRTETSDELEFDSGPREAWFNAGFELATHHRRAEVLP